MDGHLDRQLHDPGFQERRRCEREGETREDVEIEEEEELALMHTDRNEWILKGYSTDLPDLKGEGGGVLSG